MKSSRGEGRSCSFAVLLCGQYFKQRGGTCKKPWDCGVHSADFQLEFWDFVWKEILVGPFWIQRLLRSIGFDFVLNHVH